MTASRFSQVSRRAFLGGATMAAVTGLAACGQKSTTPAAAPSATGPATASSPTTEASSAEAAPTASATTAGGATLPATAKATVSFTYTAGDANGGGFVKNPYYAVWVEDAAGALVKTLLLCHQQGEDRWLNEMSAWYAASGGNATSSEGTRAAGSYQVSWDGTDATGARVPAGTYTLCIEANREHGSESLITSAQAFGSEPLDVSLGTNGELTAAHLKYVA